MRCIWTLSITKIMVKAIVKLQQLWAAQGVQPLLCEVLQIKHCKKSTKGWLTREVHESCSWLCDFASFRASNVIL